jgi:predicted CXXCH cytochrome family protein
VIVVALGLVVIAAVAYLARNVVGRGNAPGPIGIRQPRTAPAYVGGTACTACHQAEALAWQGSHHQRAMAPASDSTVLGNFNDASFTTGGVTSHFFRRNGKFMVRTDGPDGALTDYEISFTFGVWPLQQYLILFPGGRRQALGIAWDSRSRAEGGQRWFDLYPGQQIDHTDPLHWTGLYQNWALQCAECHSTDLRKGYDADSNRYRTTYSDISVSCEACHGPGAAHLDWAAKRGTGYGSDSTKGLVVRLRSRWDEAWPFASDTAAFASRDRPVDAALINDCAPCHARRSTITPRDFPGAPLEDTHRPALLTPPLYHADGQQRDEVYVWGSFRQTRMYQAGVTCVDCHEPHGLALRAEGNALCTRCHNATVFDSPRHHFHRAGTREAQCVECHMPARNYMVIDARRDHAIRIPRPDLSQTIGTPNACTDCHTDRAAAWAASAMDRWYTSRWRKRPSPAATLAAGSSEGVKALPALLDLARESGQSAVIRATALQLAGRLMRPELLRVVPPLLNDSDPGVRTAALGLLEPFESAARVAGAELLLDSVRGVRLEAARILVDLPDTLLAPEARTARTAAIAELIASLQADADWPTSNVTLGNLYLRLGRREEGIAAYRRALALDPQFAPAYVNLADSYRDQGNDAEGERVLRDGVAHLPRAAELHHALGLLLVRSGDKGEALQEFATAATLAPDQPRFAYVYAIALHSGGQAGRALTVLRDADRRHPYDLEILSALISINREQGDAHSALAYARKAAEALPDDPAIRRLVAELEGSSGS